MAREYVPLPLEYLEEMKPLSDADFGRLVRALLLYARDGMPVELDGDCRFYCARVMNKDRYYAEKFAEEEEKAARRSCHARKAINARYAAEQQAEYPGIPENTREGNNITNHINTSHNNSIHTKDTGAEPEEASAAALAIPLADGSEYCVKVTELEEWKKAFPAVDVLQELGEMRAWCLSNPTLRKTGRGVRRFINTWLSKEQDKGHRGKAAEKAEHAFVPSEL